MINELTENRYFTTEYLLLFLLLWDPSSLDACPLVVDCKLGRGAGLSFPLWCTLLHLRNVNENFRLFNLINNTGCQYQRNISFFIFLFFFYPLSNLQYIQLSCLRIRMLQVALDLLHVHACHVHLTSSWDPEIVRLKGRVFRIASYIFRYLFSKRNCARVIE